MTTRYLTRPQFNKLHAIPQRSTLTNLLKPGGKLAESFNVWPNSGTQVKTIDTEHPSVIDWLEKRERSGKPIFVNPLNPLDAKPDAQAKPKPKAKKPSIRKPKPEPQQPPDNQQVELNQFITDEDMKMLQLTPHTVNSMTVSKFFLMFGSAQSLKDWINSVHKSLQAEKLDIEIQKMRGDLVDKIYLKTVMSHIDGLQSTLLTSAVKNIVTQVTAMSKSEQPKAHIENQVAEIISNNIKFAKTQTAKAVKDVAL